MDVMFGDIIGTFALFCATVLISAITLYSGFLLEPTSGQLKPNSVSLLQLLIISRMILSLWACVCVRVCVCVGVYI